MAAVVEQLKKQGCPIQDSDLAQIWPTRHAHINFYGHYHSTLRRLSNDKGYAVYVNPTSYLP
jgi:hypothetical protein